MLSLRIGLALDIIWHWERGAHTVESGGRDSNEAPEIAEGDIGECSCGDVGCVGDAGVMTL
jgi:hypothetical protein